MSDKFCVDCRYCWRPTANKICSRPTGPIIDVVNGPTNHYLEKPCRKERKKAWFGKPRCGPDAVFFVPKGAPVPPKGGSGIMPPPNQIVRDGQAETEAERAADDLLVDFHRGFEGSGKSVEDAEALFETIPKSFEGLRKVSALEDKEDGR